MAALRPALPGIPTPIAPSVTPTDRLCAAALHHPPGHFAALWLKRLHEDCRFEPPRPYRALVLVQPIPSLTDLALALVTLYLVWRLPRGGEVSSHWRAAFAWAVGTALAGALYHGVFVGIPQANGLSWAVTSIMVVVVVSYLLAASVAQVLGRNRAMVFWLLRSVGLVAYVVIAVTGHASITAIMWCESITMASVVGLWVWAWHRHHPMGRLMLIAVGASIAAAMLRLVPGAAALTGLDPDSAYHLAQIGGMVLLYHAVASADGDPTPRPA